MDDSIRADILTFLYIISEALAVVVFVLLALILKADRKLITIVNLLVASEVGFSMASNFVLCVCGIVILQDFDEINFHACIAYEFSAILYNVFNVSLYGSINVIRYLNVCKNINYENSKFKVSSWIITLSASIASVFASVRIHNFHNCTLFGNGNFSEILSSGYKETALFRIMVFLYFSSCVAFTVITDVLIIRKVKTTQNIRGRNYTFDLITKISMPLHIVIFTVTSLATMLAAQLFYLDQIHKFTFHFVLTSVMIVNTTADTAILVIFSLRFRNALKSLLCSFSCRPRSGRTIAPYVINVARRTTTESKKCADASTLKSFRSTTT